MQNIQIKPIGRIKNNFDRQPPRRKSWEDVISKIIIKSEFSECLEGLERYSHIVVLYWMDKFDLGVIGFPLGTFANRSPLRPNPVGLTIVELISRNRNTLVVRGLDAYNDSPVIDIKPYTGHPKDLILSFRSPDRF